MDNREARALLGLHRAGDGENDPRLAEAKKQAAADPDLTSWLREEQELDRVIGEKLASIPVPADLRARIISRAVPLPVTRASWRRPTLLAAAAVVALAALFGSWHGPFSPAASLADYRAEMVDFISVRPTLGLETADLARINGFLAKSGAPSQFNIPQPLRSLEPVGCQKLRFRGHDVALICFQRESGKLAHLFVVNKAALRGLQKKPQFAAEDKWMTATWADGDHGYLLTVQGDQSAAEKYLRDI